MRWLSDGVRLATPAQQVVFQEYVNTVTEAAGRMERLVAEIHHHVKTWPFYPMVQALMTMRGARLIVAVSVIMASAFEFGCGSPTLFTSRWVMTPWPGKKHIVV